MTQVPVVSVKKAAAGNVAGKKKKQQRKSGGRQSGGQSSQAVAEQVAGAVQDDAIDPDEETYCLCGQVRNKYDFTALKFNPLRLKDILRRDDLVRERRLRH